MATKKQNIEVNPEELLDSGAHFGHQVKRWNPRMDQYIWSSRGGVHIFDLTITAQKLEEAGAFLAKAASEGKKIVMVGTKRQAADIVKEEAKRIGAFYVTERWMGGTITNWEEIKIRVKKLTDLKNGRETGEFSRYTKRERVMIDREIDRLERFFGGLVGLTGHPDILFVVDTQKERIAVREAKSKGIAVVGVVDSNGDPDMVDYVIPANDDAVRSIKIIVESIGRAIESGMKNIKKVSK